MQLVTFQGVKVVQKSQERWTYKPYAVVPMPSTIKVRNSVDTRTLRPMSGL
jgi:hypothetical protein